MADNYIVNYVKGVFMALIATLMAIIGQNLNKPKPVAYPPSFPGAKAIKKEDVKGNGVLYDAYLVDIDVYRKYAPNGGKTTSAPIPPGDPVDGFPIFTVQYGYEAQGNMYSDGLIRGIVEDVFADEVDPKPISAAQRAANVYAEAYNRDLHPKPLVYIAEQYGKAAVDAILLADATTLDTETEKVQYLANTYDLPWLIQIEWVKDIFAKVCGGVWTPPSY